MPHRDAGRLMSVLAVTGILLTTVTGPARAADPISAAFPNIEVPVGGTSIDPLGPSLWSTIGPTTLTGAKVSYDLSGVPGVRITPSRDGGGECVTPSPARVVCTDPRELSFEGETIELYLPVEVSAARSAEPGDTGKVTITFSADDLAPITGVSRVRVVDGRDTLPITGPTTTVIGALGLLLLGAGLTGLFLARRRRARFLA